MSLRDIVVIGSSAGGLAVLSRLCSDLPRDFPGAILLVQHIGGHRSTLPQILSSRGPLEAVHPVDDEEVRRGRIYIAPPDRHMLLDGARIRLTHGPKEHHTRPAIDPLFRSAALAYGPRVIGVVLTGNLDDGTAGLQAIKACGGLAVVQDPDDAQAPSMPESALASVAVDRCVGIDQLADTLMELVAQPVSTHDWSPPGRLVNEHLASLDRSDILDKLADVGAPSTLVCPECSGTLWEISGSKPPRYRCHTGHAYSLRSLTEGLTEGTEAALWSALRALQDLETIMYRLAEDSRAKGDDEARRHAESEARRISQKAAMVRKLVES